jgi:hypothetical protein
MSDTRHSCATHRCRPRCGDSSKPLRLPCAKFGPHLVNVHQPDRYAAFAEWKLAP